MAEFTVVAKDRLQHAPVSEVAWKERINNWLATKGETAKLVVSRHPCAANMKRVYAYCTRHIDCTQSWQFKLEKDENALWFTVYNKGEHAEEQRTVRGFLTEKQRACVSNMVHEPPLRAMAKALIQGTPASHLPSLQSLRSARNTARTVVQGKGRDQYLEWLHYLDGLPGSNANVEDLEKFDWIRLDVKAEDRAPDGMGVFVMPVMLDMVRSMAGAKSLGVQVYDGSYKMDTSNWVLLARSVAQPHLDPQKALLRTTAIPIAFARTPKESTAAYEVFLKVTDAYFKSQGCDLKKCTKCECFDGSAAAELAQQEVHPNVSYGRDVRHEQVAPFVYPLSSQAMVGLRCNRGHFIRATAQNGHLHSTASSGALWLSYSMYV